MSALCDFVIPGPLVAQHQDPELVQNLWPNTYKNTPQGTCFAYVWGPGNIQIWMTPSSTTSFPSRAMPGEKLPRPRGQGTSNKSLVYPVYDIAYDPTLPSSRPHNMGLLKSLLLHYYQLRLSKNELLWCSVASCLGQLGFPESQVAQIAGHFCPS